MPRDINVTSSETFQRAKPRGNLSLTDINVTCNGASLSRPSARRVKFVAANVTNNHGRTSLVGAIWTFVMSLSAALSGCVVSSAGFRTFPLLHLLRKTHPHVQRLRMIVGQRNVSRHVDLQHFTRHITLEGKVLLCFTHVMFCSSLGRRSQHEEIMVLNTRHVRSMLAERLLELPLCSLCPGSETHSGFRIPPEPHMVEFVALASIGEHAQKRNGRSQC